MRWFVGPVTRMVLAAALLSLGSCADFRPSTTTIDAGKPARDDCPLPVVATMTVDGIDVQNGQQTPGKTVLIGDTVTLRATGSCVQNPSIAYEWNFESTELAATADGALSAETVTIYPPKAGPFTVALTVKDGDGSAAQSQGVAFAAAGWTTLDHFPNAIGGLPLIRGLSASTDNLWIASRRGAYRSPLVNPESGIGYTSVEDILSNGDAMPLPESTLAVHYDPGANYVWFSDLVDSEVIHRVTLTDPPSNAQIDVPARGQIRDIGPFSPTGVVAASSAGVFLSAGSGAFGEVSALDTHAVVSDGVLLWAGTATQLVGIDPNGVQPNVTIDVFAGVDAIETIAVRDSNLWIGSTGRKSIARFDPARPASIVYNNADGLPDAEVYDLAVDMAGDVWAATRKGVARFKADRQIWLTMDGDGLQGRTDLRAIAIDESGGRRAVYVGGQSGLTYTHVP
ncbi:MAG: PKD domain-containing protein [Proteobacteria bacterium]|nr:PKD domain-containing protein [Pseudomonadota bacterium]